MVCVTFAPVVRQPPAFRAPRISSGASYQSGEPASLGRAAGGGDVVAYDLGSLDFLAAGAGFSAAGPDAGRLDAGRLDAGRLDAGRVGVGSSMTTGLGAGESISPGMRFRVAI